jgi:O-antigen/teichoic acid export membrane protein
VASTVPDSPDSLTATATPTRRIHTKGLALRNFTARGVLVNTLFDVGVGGLTLIRGFIVAALLTRADYGIWGILVVSLGVLARLKLVGISDKYVQQEESDQELAFQKAFTLEVLMTVAATIPLIVVLPAIVVVYGQPDLIAPGALVISMLGAYALQTPLWIYYRKMDFFRQRLLGTVEPVVGLIVAVVLAALGAGYWALAIGAAAGAWAGAGVAVATSVYPLRWRYDRGSLRLYAGFSGPLFIATACTVVLANATAIATNAHLGLAGVGAVALAANITAFTTRVDDLVGGTLYPAICAIQNRAELLRESFVKSNRLALIWAMPFGIAVALFAGDLVHFVIGEKWHSSIVLLQAMGLASAIAHVGWNWDDYLRARSNTRPLAIAGVITTASFLACLPLLFVYGLPGLAAAVAIQALVALLFRAVYVTRLFDGFGVVRHAVRAALPALLALALVLIVRALEGTPRTLPMAVGEFCLYVAATVVATWTIEGRLLREAIGYLFKPSSRAPALPT